ncbi:hypothetical protein B0A50_01030 [Salinomyces thailandicus]|uniref:Uncharacterized protein n=1 Tax=Salinomyces thailandicus TaxID=706561 RepID=A0A4U0UEK0_9PEZI|nr:hypothetical protein B0A50_01030 [Salinomyces thailandica]
MPPPLPPPLSDNTAPSSMVAPSSTLSLAILPTAPLNYAARPTPPSKRPKLSLNTTQTPTLLGGKGSTSLRLETLSAVSPTARNTFSNAYEPKLLNDNDFPIHINSKKPHRPTSTPLAIAVPSTPTTADSSPPTSTPELTSSSSASTLNSLPSFSADAQDQDVPYTLAPGLSSILTNGPGSRARKRSSPEQSPRQAKMRSFPPSPSPVYPASVLAPAGRRRKHVAFTIPLTETIAATTQVLASSGDLGDDILEATTTLGFSADAAGTLERSEGVAKRLRRAARGEGAVLKRRGNRGSCFSADSLSSSLPSSSSSSEEEEEEEEEEQQHDDEDSEDSRDVSERDTELAATPVAGRRQKHRRWRWTLGPLVTEDSSSLPQSIGRDAESVGKETRMEKQRDSVTEEWEGEV